MVASCWLFLYDLYYDARIHEHPETDVLNMVMERFKEKSSTIELVTS